MRKTIKLWLPFLCILLFNNCSKDDQDELGINCLEKSTNMSEPAIECQESQISPVCNDVDIGDFFLEDNSMEYASMFCYDVGTSIAFENQDGEVINLTMLQKRFSSRNSRHNSFIKCNDSPATDLFLCIHSEYIQLALFNEKDRSELLINIETNPDVTTTLFGLVGDFLEISRRQNSSFYNQEMNNVIAKRTLTYTNTPTEDNYNSIQLNGVEYRNVLSNVLHPNQNCYKYYYNRELGLIGFVDLKGVLWSLM